jgi:DNA-binding NarL/FixJ family response regulator
LHEFQDKASLGDNIVAPLTQRERQILTYIADGNTNKQIANILNISEQTIKNHVSAILRKLNANDRAHAVVLAIRRGLIPLSESK